MLKSEPSFDSEETKETILSIVDRTELYVLIGLEPHIAEETAAFDICVDKLLMKQGFAIESVIPTIAWIQ